MCHRRNETDQVDREGQAEQHQPEVEMGGVAGGRLVRVVEPPARRRRPHALAQDLESLRPHCSSLHHHTSVTADCYGLRGPPPSAPASSSDDTIAGGRARSPVLLRDSETREFWTETDYEERGPRSEEGQHRTGDGCILG